MTASLWDISEIEKQSILSLIAKGKEEEKRNERFAIFSFDEMCQLFNNDEATVFKEYLSFDPKSLGKSLPYLGIKDPDVLTIIRNQPFSVNVSELKDVPPIQYLPLKDIDALEKMNLAMERDLGKKLLVLYGYRSPARQVFLFFDHLNRTYRFDFDEATKRVFPPEYSEHASGVIQGIDFITQDGIKGNSFENTPEYSWLKENAGKFDFIESYPPDNKFGVVWEPWHWKYVGN